MALDEAHHRVFVGCRRPAKLLVYDMATGKEIAAVDIGGDTDDIYYDAARGRLYVTCGEGVVDVIKQESPDRYARTARTHTAAGARTAFYIPELSKLCVAVPHRGNQAAEIRVYEVEN